MGRLRYREPLSSLTWNTASRRPPLTPESSGPPFRDSPFGLEICLTHSLTLTARQARNNGFEGGRNLEADGEARTLAARRPVFNDCTIQVAALLEIPGEAPPDFEDLVFECELNPFDAPGGRSNIYKKVQGTKSQMNELQGMLDSGDLVPGMSTLRLGLVEGDADTTEQAELDGNNVKLPQGMQIKNRVEKLGNGKFDDKHPSNFFARRRLQNGGLTGQKPMLVVKVIDPNGLQRTETPTVIADKVFGTSELVVLRARETYTFCATI